MMSNQRPSNHGGSDYASNAKPAGTEETIRTEKIQIERKTFIFTLKENPRGQFLRITEDVGGRRDTIIVPATGLEDFKRVIDEMLELSAEQGGGASSPGMFED